jgi:hydroxymethylglutaryl-CoA lyase
MSGTLEVVEVCPRDGLQNDPAMVSTEDKVALVKRLAAAGARRIEAVSFVHPKAVPQMADAEAVMERLRGDNDLRARGVRLSGLALNRRGFDRAIAAGVDEVNFAVMATDTFNQRNQGAPTAQTLVEIVAAVPVAREAGVGLAATIGVAFGCPFEGEVPVARVVGLVRALADAGLEEIALADTIGVGDPVAVERLVAAARAAAPDARLRCHFHNTRNTGLANVYAAWRAGAVSIDASVGGVGGCPFAPGAAGNIPTEDTVYMLHRMGIATGYDLAGLIDTAGWLSGVLGKVLPGMVSKAGPFPA